LGEHFIPFRGGADGPAGLLLAINPASVSHISSYWDKSLGQNVLRLHLNNGRYIKVFEADTADTLTSLGLDEFVEDWTFNLEKDVG
jgi:hypothetical protein